MKIRNLFLSAFLLSSLNIYFPVFAQNQSPSVTHDFEAPPLSQSMDSYLKTQPKKYFPYEKSEFLTGVNITQRLGRVYSQETFNQGAVQTIKQRKDLRIAGVAYRKAYYRDENNYLVFQWLPTEFLLASDPTNGGIHLREAKATAFLVSKSIPFSSDYAPWAIDLKVGNYQRTIDGQSKDYWTTMQRLDPISIKISTQNTEEKPNWVVFSIEWALKDKALVMMDDIFVKMNQAADLNGCEWCNVGDPSKGWLKVTQSNNFALTYGFNAARKVYYLQQIGWSGVTLETSGKDNSTVRVYQGRNYTRKTLGFGIDEYFPKLKKYGQFDVFGSIESTVQGMGAEIDQVDDQGMTTTWMNNLQLEYTNQLYVGVKWTHPIHYSIKKRHLK